jgi:hypothetical protein
LVGDLFKGTWRTTRQGLCRLGLGGVVLGLAASFLFLGSATAEAANGSIAGTVTSAATHSPIESVDVCAYSSTTGYYAGCSYTDSGGHYTIGALPPGAYKVGFFPYGLDYASQYYAGETTRAAADSVQVSSGATTPNIDAQLQAGGQISGNVIESATSDPLEGAEVCATEIGGDEGQSCADTSATGEYTIRGLRAGSFRVAFFPGYGEVETGVFGTRNLVYQYWDNRASAAEAEPVSVSTDATTSGISAAMRKGAIISGAVSDATTHTGIEDVGVCAFEVGESEPRACASTNTNGKYAIGGLPTGSYKVRFTPEYGDSHGKQFYSGKASLSSADPVSVTEGSTTSGINAELPELGKISGHVSAVSGGGSLENIQVCAEPIHYEVGSFQCASTNASGNYTIASLPEDAYVVHFSGGLDHVSQYYSGKSSYSEAQRISVANGATTPGINAELATAGRIEGHVTEAGSGTDLAGIQVCAAPSGKAFIETSNCAYSDGSGHYTLGGLTSGFYQVRFTPGTGEISPGHYGPLNYLTQYYSGKEDEAEAQAIAVTAGSTTGVIDAAMKSGGKISGTVSAASGHAPLAGIEVCAGIASGSSNGSCTSTEADGTYAITGLRSGEYKVRFKPGGVSRNYVRQFYSGKSTRSAADPVPVTAGQTKAGVNAEMQTGGKITGTVTDAGSHAPIKGVYVCVINYSTPCALTDAAGQYELQGLPTGSYKVRFDAYEAAEYLRQYYQGKESSSEANAVPVTAGATTIAINAGMVKGGTISGTVTDAGSSAGAPAVSACAIEEPGGEFASCGYTDSSGHYSIKGLKAGSYAVRFSPGGNEPGGEGSPNYNYVTQYYSGKATLLEAGSVAVSNGTTTSGVNAALHEGGKISGRVTAASGGAAIGAAEVCIYAGGEPDFEHCDYTNGSGEYTIEGLTTGSYKVVFYGGFSLTERNYLFQFYNGKSSAATGDPVSVTVGSTQEHVDAALATGGQITGHVVDASSSKPIQGASVCALEVGGEGEIVSCGSTNSLGNYTISSLSTGSYKVEFSAYHYEYEEEVFYEGEGEEPSYEELYVRQYWSGSSALGSAQVVGVTAGSATPGISASMVAGSGGHGGQHVLSVGFAGSGSGMVSSSPAGMSCSASCAHGFESGSTVNLSATPANGSTFAGWSGACAGTGPCQVTLNGDVSVVATFNAAGGPEGGGGGGSPSGGTPPVLTTSTPPTSPKPAKKLTCKKGFKKKKVKGKTKCVRAKHHKHKNPKR